MDFNEKDIIDTQLAKYILQETSSAETEEIQYWIYANKENEKYYTDFRLLWEKSKGLHTQDGTVEQDAWLRFLNRLQQRNMVGEQKRAIRKMSSFWQAAACFVGVLMMGAIVYYYTSRSGATTIRSDDVVLTDTLPDGSIINLNKHSNLSYKGSFNKKERVVDFDGEGFFRIAPNKQKPFVIHTNKVRIEVVGTSFNVNSTNGATEIVVQTGIVKVLAQGKEMDLHPNEKVTIAANNVSDWQKKKTEEDLYSYYATGKIVCNKTPLRELVAKLNMVYDVQIVINDPQKADLEITTTFDHENIDEILNIIQKTFNLHIEKQGKSIKIL